MRREFVLRALLTFGTLAAATACAAHSLRPLPSQPLESFLSLGTAGEIQIALEPYDTDAKTMSILNRQLISEGFLPVLVVLRNNGESVYEVNPYEIYLVNPAGSASAAATATDVARTTGKSELSLQSRETLTAVGQLLWPISLLLLPMLVADQSAQEHNKRLAREYLAMGLPYYIPQGESRGLIFFKVAKGQVITLGGYRVSFRKIGPRGSAEHLQIEIPIVGTPRD